MTLREALLTGRRRPRRSAEGSPLAYRGDGYEFIELREYVHGDDVRRIDWAASARSAQLQTRVMLEDVALTLAVYVDRTDSMRSGRRAPLVQAADEIRRTWLGAALRSDKTRELETLEETRALPRGTALLAVGDFFQIPDEDELALLAHRYDCTAMIARDPWQDELPLDGFVRVRDAESGAVRLLYIGSRERARYGMKSREREAALVERFSRCGWRTGVFTESDGRDALLQTFGANR